MKSKRGQAALEFLTTYGWAFLVILVMIGALAYFGILDPTRFLPQRCQFGAEMHCEQFALDAAAGQVNFALTNALPDHVTVTQLEWSVPEDETWYVCEDTRTVDDGGGADDISDGDGEFARESVADFVCIDATGAADDALTAVLVSGDKQRVQIRITYNEGLAPDAAYSKYLYGEVYANVR